MSRLSAARDYLLAAPVTSVGRRTLKHPLHRIFLRDSTGAERGPDQIWKIQRGVNEAHHLEALIEHFDRYGIEYQLDSACQGILNARIEKRAQYERVLADSLAIKVRVFRCVR